MLNLHPDQRQQILDLRDDIGEVSDHGLSINSYYFYGMIDALGLIWSDYIDLDPEAYSHTNSLLAEVMGAVQKYRKDYK